MSINSFVCTSNGRRLLLKEVAAGDTAYQELLASYEAALETAKRSLTIARELADAQQDGRRLPEAVITAYRASIARDEDTWQALRGKVAA